MDCKKLQQRIDELISSEEIQLNTQEQLHLDDCQVCQQYFADAEKANQIINRIQQWEPVLDNPEELTDSIMSSIPKQSHKLTARSINFRTATRILAAAIVTLLLTLGVEQYMVLNKVQLLEAKMGKVQHDHPTKYSINKASLIDIEQILKVSDNGYALENILRWYQLEQFKNADFTFNDLKRYNNKAGTLNSFFK